MSEFVVTVLQKGKVLGAFTFNKNVVTIGRSADSDVRIDSKTVSRQQAELLRTTQGFAVFAHNSTNVTRVNGEQVPPEESVPLQPGDKIRIADRFDLTLALVEHLETSPLADPPKRAPRSSQEEGADTLPIDQEEQTVPAPGRDAAPAAEAPPPRSRPDARTEPLGKVAPDPAQASEPDSERPTAAYKRQSPPTSERLRKAEPPASGPMAQADPPPSGRQRKAEPPTSRGMRKAEPPTSRGMRQSENVQTQRPTGGARPTSRRAPQPAAPPPSGGTTPILGATHDAPVPIPPPVKVEVVASARQRQGPAGARLVCRLNKNEQRLEVHDDFYVGGGEDSDLCLSGGYAPRRAALVVRVEGRYRLYNTSPLPETVLVNGKGIQGYADLVDGDELEVYGVALTFEKAT